MPIFNLGIRSFTRVSFLIAELNIACMSFALAQGGGPVPTGPVPIGEQPPLDGAHSSLDLMDRGFCNQAKMAV